MEANMKRNPFNEQMFVVDGKVYRVMDFPSEEEIQKHGIQTFKKGIAYRYQTNLSKLLLPYHGKFDKEDFSFSKPVGIYHVVIEKNTYRRIIFPRNKKEKAQYSLDQERSIMAAVSDAYHNDQFADLYLSAGDSGSSVFIPPMHEDDDMLNKFVKMLIRMKNAPFKPYGKRLESLAVDKKHGMEGVNIKNNTMRALRFNRALSANKAIQYTENWEIDIALIARDKPNAMHPFSEDRRMYVYYPAGQPFEVNPDQLVNIGPIIEQTIIDDHNRETEMESEESDDDI